MKKIQCELCGSNDIVKVDSDVFQCAHCGCKYTAQQAQNMIFGKVETTIGTAELSRLIKNTETQIKTGQDAHETIGRLIKEFPADYHGYWLYIEDKFSTAYRIKSVRYGIPSCKGMYDILLKILEDDNVLREKAQQFWESNFKKIYDGLVNGEISGLLNNWHTNTGDFNVHPLMEKAYNMGINNAKILRENHIFLNNCGYYKPQIMPYGYEINYALGKEISYKTYDDSYCQLLDEPLIITKDNIPEIKRKAEENMINFARKYNKCPACGHNLAKPFLSKKLKCQNKNCGKTYPI